MNKQTYSRDIYVIYSICIHLNYVGNGNDNLSSEKHFENSKTCRGSYVDQ